MGYCHPKIFILITFASLVFGCSDDRFYGGGKRRKLNSAPAKPKVLRSLAVSCAKSEINVGEKTECSAKAKFDDGSKVDVTKLAKWSSNKEKFAVVDDSGVVKGLAKGKTAIRADYKEQSADDDLTVDLDEEDPPTPQPLPDRKIIGFSLKKLMQAVEPNPGILGVYLTMGNLRGNDGDLTLSYKVQTVDNTECTFSKNDRVASTVNAGLFDQELIMTCKYKYIPDITLYTGQILSVDGADKKNVKFQLLREFSYIVRPFDAAATAPIDTTVTGVAGHP